MKIDKKLIVLALQAYRKLITETSDISDHDETLDTIIKLNAQIKLIKEWKKQTKCSISGYTIVS